MDLSAELLGHLSGTLRIGFGQDDSKLLSTVTGREVARTAGRGVEKSCYQAQRAISFEVAEVVIEQLEVVDVDEKKR